MAVRPSGVHVSKDGMHSGTKEISHLPILQDYDRSASRLCGMMPMNIKSLDVQACFLSRLGMSSSSLPTYSGLY